MSVSVTPAPSARFLGVLVVVGWLWRLVVGASVVLPREDGVNYLWMAERFAAGDATAALSEVFSPLLAMFIAVPVWLGIEPFTGGQLALALAGALVVVPVARSSEALFPGTGRLAALLVFVASRPVLLGAEIHSEPLFLSVAGGAFVYGVRERFVMCGLLSGLAFWIRPEAALIPLAFSVALRTRRAWSSFVPLLFGIAALALWRGSCGHGYDPVPKLEFLLAHNVAGETDPLGFVLRSLRHLLDIPWLLVEAFAAVALLAVYGCFHRRHKPTLWLLLFAVIVICAYVPRRRFLVDWMFAVVPLAAVGLSRLPARGWWLAAIIVLDLALGLTGGVKPDRIAERAVAEHLRERLQTGDSVAGDMTRVIYFAGFRPLAPRHFTAEELIQAGRNARFVVLRRRRSDTTPAVVDGLPGHLPLTLPDELADLAEARGMIVLERR